MSLQLLMQDDLFGLGIFDAVRLGDGGGLDIGERNLNGKPAHIGGVRNRGASLARDPGSTALGERLAADSLVDGLEHRLFPVFDLDHRDTLLAADDLDLRSARACFLQPDGYVFTETGG